MSSFDLTRIRAQSGIYCLDYHVELGSTNDRAIELLKSHETAIPGLGLPMLVLTDHQMAGRGQHQRTWIAAPGSLTCTLCLPARNDASDLWMSLATGLAVCASVEALLPSTDLKIKWPNDVLLNNRKLAGILIEKVSSHLFPESKSVLVIGIGINVNNTIEANDLAEADHRQPNPTSIFQSTGHSIDLTALLIGLIQTLIHLHGELCHSTDRIRRQVQERLLFLNHWVEIELPDRTRLSGHCVGLGSTGELLIGVDHDHRAISSGTVVGWR